MSRITNIWKATNGKRGVVVVEALVDGELLTYEFNVPVEQMTEIKLHSYRFIDDDGGITQYLSNENVLHTLSKQEYDITLIWAKG